MMSFYVRSSHEDYKCVIAHIRSKGHISLYVRTWAESDEVININRSHEVYVSTAHTRSTDHMSLCVRRAESDEVINMNRSHKIICKRSHEVTG